MIDHMNIVSTILHKESEEAKQQMRETQESVGGMTSLYLIYILILKFYVIMYLQQSWLAKERFWILELSVDKPSVADKAITTNDEVNMSGDKMEEKGNGTHTEIIIYRVLFWRFLLLVILIIWPSS